MKKKNKNREKNRKKEKTLSPEAIPAPNEKASPEAAEEENITADEDSVGALLSDNNQAADNDQAAVDSTSENLPVVDNNEKAVNVAEESKDGTLTDDEAYMALGPQSIWQHLLQMLLAVVPVAGFGLLPVWIILGGSPFSTALVAIIPASVLALFVYWACGCCVNLNRRRFARAYFLWLALIAAILAVLTLIAYAFGSELSPVLRKIMNAFSVL